MSLDANALLCDLIQEGGVGISTNEPLINALLLGRKGLRLVQGKFRQEVIGVTKHPNRMPTLSRGGLWLLRQPRCLRNRYYSLALDVAIHRFGTGFPYNISKE